MVYLIRWPTFVVLSLVHRRLISHNPPDEQRQESIIVKCQMSWIWLRDKKQTQNPTHVRCAPKQTKNFTQKLIILCCCLWLYATIQVKRHKWRRIGQRELKYDSQTGRNILIIIQITDGLALLLMMLVDTGHRQDKINVDL